MAGAVFGEVQVSFFVAAAVFGEIWNDCSDPARIILGMVSDRSRIVNSVSCVTRINHEIHFSWQAQYLVSLDNDTCCSAHCK